MSISFPNYSVVVNVESAENPKRLVKNDETEFNVKYIRYSDGQFYSGEVVNGLAHGKGLMINNDNTLSHSGLFYKGIPHGAGTAYFHGKMIYSGDIENGLFHGNGTRYTETGVYEGKFEFGKYVGK